MSALVGSAVFSGTASAVTRSCLDRPVTLRMPLAVCELIWTLALAVLVAVESLWLPMLWRWRAQCFPTSSWDVWTASLQLFLLFNFGDCGRVNGNCNQTKSRIELYCIVKKGGSEGRFKSMADLCNCEPQHFKMTIVYSGSSKPWRLRHHIIMLLDIKLPPLTKY